MEFSRAQLCLITWNKQLQGIPWLGFVITRVLMYVLQPYSHRHMHTQTRAHMYTVYSVFACIFCKHMHTVYFTLLMLYTIHWDRANSSFINYYCTWMFSITKNIANYTVCDNIMIQRPHLCLGGSETRKGSYCRQCVQQACLFGAVLFVTKYCREEPLRVKTSYKE